MSRPTNIREIHPDHTEERVADVGDRLTMHTAQAIASTMQRDFARHGV